MSERPRCVGCGRTDKECGEYGKDNPVEDDGTYADNKFVCTECYVVLVPYGLDVGPARQVQANMVKFKRLKEQRKI